MSIKKENENEMFFVTVFQKIEMADNDIAPDLGDTRCWGFYPELETAAEALHENWTDMQETIYNYAVIEKIGPGIAPNCFHDERQFFKWDKEKEGFYEITEPDEMKHICNFALG